MIDALKVGLILAIALILFYPLLHIRPKGRFGRLATVHGQNYLFPDNKRNLVFFLLSIVEVVLLAVLFELLNGIADLIKGIPFLGNLIVSGLDKVSPQVDFVVIAIRLVVVNMLILFVFLFFTPIICRILNAIFGRSEEDKEWLKEKLEKRRQKRLARKKKKAAEQEEEPADEDDPKNKRVEKFEHSEDEENSESDEKSKKKEKKKKEHSRFYKAVVGLFFQAPDCLYARPWLIRAERVLQNFVYLFELLYFAITVALFLAIFYPLDSGFYHFLVDIIHIERWYLYPFITILILQELCYLLKTPVKPKEDESGDKNENEISDEEMDARLTELQNELKKRFDQEHGLRYYPDSESDKEPPYVYTNQQFASALDFIGRKMLEESGRTVQSYMKTLDTLFGGEHIYVGSPFYSEFGEYVILYTYTRLLAGARVVFVIGNDRDAERLKKYIRDRLTDITGSSEECTWRVYTADERLDQADVFIATPEDFKSDNIVEHFPGFFEEVCTVVFINTDDIIAQESYLCCVIANRLQNGSGGRANFLFLTEQMLYGFASSTLPKFFCVEQVLNMSDATQVQSVSYTLWNRESANGRIYDKTGHKLTGLECIIADLAYTYGVDGIRILTSAMLEPSERKVLESHDIEINDLYKPIPRINYMVYSDDYFNLAAVLFAATRFRGRKKSVAHIISRPYLLRDYFVSKATRDDYVNRASFIQPRMAEHINQHKLSLLRILCELTGEEQISLSTFEARIRDVIGLAKKRDDVPPCEFCAELLKKDPETLSTDQLAAYLIAGLCDTEKTPIYKSAGLSAKDYFLVTNSTEQTGYSFVRDKLICFKHVKTILDRAVLSNKRVELRLNDEIIGVLPYIFPKRVPLEYMVGMSIVYKNTEYEIEQITYSSGETYDANGQKNGSQNETCTIFLRCENVTFKNCLDTIFLRRYTPGEFEPLGLPGVRHDSTSILSEIRVQKLKLDFTGSTYGFYSMMSDRQTLDFYKGVEGISNLEPELEKTNRRVLTDKKGRALLLTLTSKEACTDGMRMLLSAVFNELLRALFPKTYRCVAVCPVLKEPLPFDSEHLAETPEDRIKALYPYLSNPGEDFVETNDNQIRLVFFNDCEEDVGVLDWIFDPVCRYIQEWLVYIYSYLHWLSSFPEKKHYIYFGGEKLPECYDLAGCLNLLKNCKSVYSDSGAHDYDTANDEIDESEKRLCSFCHKMMESGRYQTFNKHRYICANCFDVIGDEESANDLVDQVRSYLNANYPGTFAHGELVKIDPPYNLTEDQALSEYYSRVDLDERVIYLEKDLPVTNAEVGILRGLIALWQKDCNLAISYAPAQLYYEELKYLRHIGQNESADWTYANLPESLRHDVDLIDAYVKGESLAPWDDEEKPKETESAEARTSFLFMQEKAKEIDDIEGETDEGDEEYSDELYDPDKTPRFWKRYLRGEQATGTEDVLPENEHDEDDPEGGAPDLDDLDGGDADENESDDEDTNGGSDGRNDSFVPSLWRQYYRMDAPGYNGDDDEEKDPEEDLSETDEPEEDPLDLSEDETPAGESDGEEPADEGEKPTEDSDGEKPADEGETPTEDSDGEEPADEDEEPTGESDGEEPADEGEEPTGESDGEEPAYEDEEPQPSGGEVKEKKPKKESWFKRLLKRIFKRKNKKHPNEETDEDEATNPKIKLYNEIVRHAKAYSEEAISREGLSDDEIDRVFQYVLGDYPELFWVHYYKYTPTEMRLVFRCKDANDKLDIKQIKRKRKEIRKGAKYFTRGITRRTPPYKAMLKIYRRLILTLDYDSLNLDTNISEDPSKDDVLRSLHSALVEHKVVCVGYAVAFQYLMHSVGITCATVTSEFRNKKGHAFNIVKIGKFCYYVDPTWGDFSDTKHSKGKNEIHYGYFCVPEREFRRTAAGQEHDHIANKRLYPTLEEFKTANHEYHRYFKSFFTRANYDEIAKAIAYQTLIYNEKEMGDFIVSLRFATAELAKNAIQGMSIATEKARAIVERKNRKKLALINELHYFRSDETGVLELYFKQPEKKKKKKEAEKE